jgi:hypothetical protein
MTKYQEYVNRFVISEIEFNEILENIHEEDLKYIKPNTWDDYSKSSDVDFVYMYVFDNVIQGILDNNHTNTDNLDSRYHKFDLYEVDSLEDLEKIKNYFSDWDIVNYEYLKEDFENE